MLKLICRVLVASGKLLVVPFGRILCGFLARSLFGGVDLGISSAPCDNVAGGGREIGRGLCAGDLGLVCATTHRRGRVCSALHCA